VKLGHRGCILRCPILRPRLHHYCGRVLKEPPGQHVTGSLVGQRVQEIAGKATFRDNIGACGVTDRVVRDPDREGVRVRQTSAPGRKFKAPVRVVFDCIVRHDRRGLVVIGDPWASIQAADAGSDPYAPSRPTPHCVLLNPSEQK